MSDNVRYRRRNHSNIKNPKAYYYNKQMKNSPLSRNLLRGTVLTASLFALIVICLPFESFGQQNCEIPPLYPHYPCEFDKEGIIDMLSATNFCIDDTTYQTLDDSTFNGPNGKMSWKSFQVGDKVGVLLDENRSIVSLWFLETSNSATPENSSATDSKVYLDGGVWKN